MSRLCARAVAMALGVTEPVHCLWQRPSADGNWMHVLYQSSLQAARALSKNGKVFGGQMMIGVTACTDKVLAVVPCSGVFSGLR